MTETQQAAIGGTKAKATMHLRVIRAGGSVEEIDVPVETDLTKEQVLELIARHTAGMCGRPASAAYAQDGRLVTACEDHIQAARNRDPHLNVVAAFGTCAARRP